jgi:hypothetical protein
VITEAWRSATARKGTLEVLIRSTIVFILAFELVVALCSTMGASSAPTDNTDGKKKIAPYALIFGTVWDAQNRPAYGVPIKIRRADQKKAKWELRSDHRGEFAQRVPAGAGEYVIWADLKAPKGHKHWKAPETKAVIQNDERIDVTLHLTE